MAQAAPLAGLHYPMVAVPRTDVPPEPRPASSGCSVQGRPDVDPLNRRASVRARASTCSFDLRIGRNGRSLCRCASRRMSACARRIRAQHPTQMRVNARKSRYGMKQSINRSINLQERKSNSWHPSAETNEFEPMPLAESNTISIELVPVPPNEVKTILPSSLRRPVSRGLAQFASASRRRRA